MIMHIMIMHIMIMHIIVALELQAIVSPVAWAKD